MFKKINIFFVVLCICLPLGVGAVSSPPPQGKVSSVKAPPTQEPIPAKAVSSKQKEGIDLIFVLDCSGSMKKTDPQDLRKPATELFVSLLGSQDRIGLVSFGGLAQTLIPLTENLPANQRFFSEAIQKQITSEALYTNLYEAVKKGYEEIKDSSRATRILLLMSDGQMDLGSKEKDSAASNELFAFLPLLIRSNIKLYTVAFTDLSDQKFLADLAEKTKGFFKMAKTDKDLHVIFSSIFEQLKLPDSVPLEGDSFLVDKFIQEVTILITKQQGTSSRLIAPSRRELVYGRLPENVNWYQTPVFDLITMKNPIPGRWKVLLNSKEGNKVFVVTELTLNTSLNQNQINQGKETSVEAWLERQGARIGEKRILDSMFCMAEVKDPKGNMTRLNLYPRSSGDKGDSKDVFSNVFTFQYPGTYSIKLTIDGKTFKRELIREVQVVSSAPPKLPPQGKIQSNAPPPSADLWGKAIKTFLLINGGFFLLAILIMLMIKWRAGRAVRPKKVKKEKPKKKGKKGKDKPAGS